MPAGPAADVDDRGAATASPGVGGFEMTADVTLDTLVTPETADTADTFEMLDGVPSPRC